MSSILSTVIINARADSFPPQKAYSILANLDWSDLNSAARVGPHCFCSYVH